MPSSNRRSTLSCVGTATTFGVLLLWGKLTLNHFQKIEGHNSLAGLANESRYAYWSLKVPAFTGTLIAFVVLLSIVFLVIRKRIIWKDACILVAVHVIMLVVFYFGIVLLEFEAFN